MLSTRVEVLWKVKLKGSKVEAATERGAKKMFLATFGDTHATKLKHSIKLHTRISYFKLIHHLSTTYHNLYWLNASELLSEWLITSPLMLDL